ncbi:MAG: hypothetical protein ACXWQO_05600 [Bdellovibrionota bacterium]
MFGFSMGNLFGLAAFLLIWIVVLLVCREIVCWYWKINHATQLLEKIHTELVKLNSEKLKNVDTGSLREITPK